MGVLSVLGIGHHLVQRDAEQAGSDISDPGHAALSKVILVIPNAGRIAQGSA
jgi:hypothetical protein